MKIYIAAPWKDKDNMPAIAEQIEALGNSITKKWWEADEPADKSPEVFQIQATDDFNGVRNADIVLVLNTAKSEGKSFEQGVAVTLGKPIIIVGKRGEFSANVFHYLPTYKWVDNLDAAVEVLKTIQWLLKEAK